jgi:hypothetical protein
VEALVDRSTITIGSARHELLVDGRPWDRPRADARELAATLHRRGVGSMTLESGINLIEVRAALAWLSAEPGGPSDTALNQSGLLITRTLVRDDAVRDAQSAIASLWRELADVTGMQDDRTGPDPFAALPMEYAGLPLIMDEAPAGATGFDTGLIVESLHGALGNVTVARRTAVALIELTSQGVTTTDDGRALIGEQVLSLLTQLGRDALTPIVTSLEEPDRQQKLVTQTIDLLPVDAAVSWLEPAAAARAHRISPEMMRLTAKLASVFAASATPATEAMFRDAAHELMQCWTPADRNPARHVELLARIAGFDRNVRGDGGTRSRVRTANVESSRLVQMSLETNEVGEDTIAAVESLLAAGLVSSLIRWTATAGDSAAARQLRAMATTEGAIRQLLLTEPVDRLEARALLDALDMSATDILIEVLGEAGSKGTRLLVRQRLAEFGAAITPRLLARLDDGPWYLTRNLLSLLRDTETQRHGEGAASVAITALLDHQQVQVRLEALRVLVSMGDERRTAALGRALRDDNERVVVAALQELGDAATDHGGLPQPIVLQLMALVDAGALSDPVSARAIRTLASARGDVVRDWLIGIVSRKSTLLRRLTLAEPTLPVVSALHVLTKVYANDPAAAKVMEVARSVRQEARWQVRESGIAMERAT